MFLGGLQPVESSWWLGYPWPIARSALNNTYTYVHTHTCTLCIPSLIISAHAKYPPDTLTRALTQHLACYVCVRACVCQVLAICRDLKPERCTCLLYYNSLCLLVKISLSVRVKTERFWSGPGIGTACSHARPSSNLMYSKWCLKTLSESVRGASWSSSLPSTSSPSGSLHQWATYSSFSIHPSVFFFPSLYLCLSSLKPSLSHWLSIMLPILFW